MTKYESVLASIDDNTIKVVQDNSVCLPVATLHKKDIDYIFINEAAFETESERAVALAHEKGHCDAGAFYNLLTPHETRSRCERRAWKRAILDQLSFDELVKAFNACRTADGVTVYDLSEYLGVTADFVMLAIRQYICMGKKVL